jgi:hypothetical protein
VGARAGLDVSEKTFRWNVGQEHNFVTKVNTVTAVNRQVRKQTWLVIKTNNVTLNNSRHSDYATGWRVRGSKPETPRPFLEPIKPLFSGIRFLSRVKRPKREADHTPPSTPWVSKIFTAKCQTRFCGLIRGPHVEKY